VSKVRPDRKDEVLLLITALILAALGFAFWSWITKTWAAIFGSDSAAAFSFLVMVWLVIDNFRLRRRIRALEPSSERRWPR